MWRPVGTSIATISASSVGRPFTISASSRCMRSSSPLTGGIVVQQQRDRLLYNLSAASAILERGNRLL